MRRKVAFSTYSIILTILLMGLLIAIMIWELKIGNEVISYIVAGLLISLCVLSLFFTPLSISVENGNVNVNMLLRTKSISLKDISSIKKCPPTMAEKRILGSGGWFGYWGWFSEPSIGKYMAYYGKASDCFLLRLKNGKQYLIGCADNNSVVQYIVEQLKTLSK